jgi:hypothetical protein
MYHPEHLLEGNRGNRKESQDISPHLLWENSIADNRHYSPFQDSLTPWSRVILEKLTVVQPVNKFPAFYAARRFITMFTTACLPMIHFSTKFSFVLTFCYEFQGTGSGR